MGAEYGGAVDARQSTAMAALGLACVAGTPYIRAAQNISHMQNVVTLIADPDRLALDDALVEAARGALAAAGGRVGTPDWLAPGQAVDLPFDGANPRDTERALRAALSGKPLDLLAQPAERRRKRLLISDMDSTIIENETLDDLADFAGVGKEVAAITWQSMNGQVEFVEALERRVAMLNGLSAAMLEEAFAKVRFIPGARTMVRTMRDHGVHTILVSGGFTYFTTRIARLAGFHEQEANVLEIEGGRLTGKVLPPIINRDGKVAALHRISAGLGIPIEDTLAIGDGANDLGMIREAGLGVAYRGKKPVAAEARARIDHTDLTSVLFFQGYRRQEFSTAP